MPGKKANSTLPSELNENWGSNYMMDGFDFDMDYGHGIENNPGSQPVPQPAMGGMSHLPDGLLVGEDAEFLDFTPPDGVEQDIEGGFDLEEMGIITASDRSDVGITDLSWLGDAHQDPDRLPSTPNDMIPELQEAWGRRTDGIHRIDLRNREEHQYQDAFQGKEDDDPLNVDKLASLIQSAMRRSAMGDLSFAQQCKKHPKLIRPMEAVEAEHGLVGNVYIRASAYPRLHRGKWAASFKKAANGCRYLIAENTPFNKEVANLLNLQVVPAVSNIDWKDAYDRYAPKLAASGRLKLGKDMSPRALRGALRKAFLSDEQAPQFHIEPTRTRVTMPVDHVSSAQAHKALVEFKPPQRAVIDWVNREKKTQAEKVVKKLGAWVQARLITKGEVDQLILTQASPLQILRSAAAIITASQKGQYQGAGTHTVFHELKREAVVSRRDWDRDLRKKAELALAKDRATLVERVLKMVSAGILTQPEANKLLTSGTDSRLVMQAASKLASEHKSSTYNHGPMRHRGSAGSDTDASHEAVRRHSVQAAQAQVVQGQRQDKARNEAQTKRAKVELLLVKVGRIAQLVEDGVSVPKLKKAVKSSFTLDDLGLIHTHLDPILVRGGFYEKKSSNQYQGFVQTQAPRKSPEMSVSPKEIRKAARWVRQQMSEGFAGDELSTLIRLRLEPKLAKASKSKLAQVREEHEGLSGHLYVDAAAYASKAGTTGCEAGALRHRANQLKFVLAMDRCEGCVFKNADGVCQKYNKTVVEDIEYTEKYRQAQLASHAASDQDDTASLFSVPNLSAALSSNLVSEFGLHNGSLDDVETADALSPSQLSEIFFGGMEL